MPVRYPEIFLHGLENIRSVKPLAFEPEESICEIFSNPVIRKNDLIRVPNLPVIGICYTT